MNIEKEVAVIAAAVLYESKELEWTLACQSVALLYNHLTSTDHMDYDMASNILQVSEQVKRPFIINGKLYKGVLDGEMVRLKNADDFDSDQKSVFVVPDFLLQKASNLNGNKPMKQGTSKIQPNKMGESEKLRLSQRETLRISLEKAQKSSQKSLNLKPVEESHAPVAGTEKSSGSGGMVLKVGNTVKIVGGGNGNKSRDQNISETVKKKGPTANPVKSMPHHNGLQGGEELTPVLPCLIFVLVHGFGVIFEELVVAHLRLYHALYGGNFKLKSSVSDFVRNRCTMEFNQKSYTLRIEKGKFAFDRSEEMAEHKISNDNYRNYYDRLKPIVCADSAEDKVKYNIMHSEAQVEIEFDELESESGPSIPFKDFADALQTSSMYLKKFYTAIGFDLGKNCTQFD